MSVKGEYRNLWAEAFGETKEQTAWVMLNVVDDDYVVSVMSPDGALASALTLQPMAIRWIGSLLPIGYLMGVATRRKLRGMGYGSAVITEALNIACRKGMVMVTLIPQDTRVCGFYSSLGFSKAIMVDHRRYTSAGSPLRSRSAGWQTVELTAPLPERFSQWAIDVENSIEGCVVHTPRQLDNAVADVEMDNGKVMALIAPDGEIRAMGFAVPHFQGDKDLRSPVLDIKAIMALNAEDEERMLRELMGQWPGLPADYRCRPSDSRPMSLGGMARIANAKALLEAVAKRRPKLEMKIRITDPLIEANNHTFVIDRGEVTVDDSAKVDMLNGRDLDVDIRVLTSIMCSSAQMGSVFALPSQRPFMWLMLD